ncbi:MAG: tRNA (adenosine(37)-N6)-threonylcarbamoyltransferase complex transferase subunit TsaD [Treponema sp.]|nr:tRNA (adenosine(37)-N6)-threonylcarbamoyltransferase complex transferase subunit TsaD [Spirochaetia bacterium]MDD6296286.1 tRNA (adenosine(37)-N6)-threonylcarbamoyltransferase complex transferase subunit TsaD [Treponema sp.]MDD7450145.1 tRNA (adenosine(37)-N6)-threonylcarbamoyltransferase complex transferase subunit TsaD [Treponema sp.]MDY2924283.1 tRNA (adenosine(37)-N6)-threonylcarbamoyltransferase complex transferase subunit TsaD [Treponema sp.]MDY5683047.1 tRNA (adenosine(37)-N6)-threony
MKILGIESSCDETAAAIVEDGHRIISNVVATQIPFHQIYKGVVPEIASRKHAEWILPVVRQALAEANMTLADVDAVAATNRPGLMGSLLIGLTFGKTLAWTAGKPFIAINHMLGHLYAAHLEQKIEYPYIGLLVSGGHTIICKVNGFDDLEILGTTVDDSVGEAFDKVSKFYGLGYPGGVIIDQLARNGNAKAAHFPVPKLDDEEHRYDVSFSGLKTAVIHQRDIFWNDKFEKTNENMCAAFQETACRTITSRLFRAVDDTGLKTVVAGGGVAANSRLRELLAERKDINCIFPPLKLCGDNGAMIAGVAWHFLQRGDRSAWNTTASARIPQFKRGLKR